VANGIWALDLSGAWAFQLAYRMMFLPPNQRHHPSGKKNSADEQGKAIEAVLHLLRRRIALRNAKNCGCKQRKHHRSREVR